MVNSPLKMKVVCSSETLESIFKFTSQPKRQAFSKGILARTLISCIFHEKSIFSSLCIRVSSERDGDLKC